MVMALYLLQIMVAVCMLESSAFIQIDVDLLNDVAVLLLDLDVYILAAYRPPSSLIQDENLVSFIRTFVLVERSSFLEILICHLLIGEWKMDWWLYSSRCFSLVVLVY